MDFLSKLKNQLASPGTAERLWSELQPQLEGSLSYLDETSQVAFFKVLGNSNFLGRWARVNPEELDALLKDCEQAKIDFPSLERHWNKRLEGIPQLDETSLLQCMLRVKYYYLFIITLRDLGQMAPFAQTALELSQLARFLMQKGLDFLLAKYYGEWGVPKQQNQLSETIPMSILAMGKLGGLELNYSSDVDLIYLYGSDQGVVLQGNRKVEYSPHQFFCRVGQELAQLLSKKSPEGFLYRVDLELRPEGISGALANSLDAMETYYESFGAYWEKQAMIKCGHGAGHGGLFERFHQMIQPFTYPKIRDFSLIQKIKEMKSKVQDAISKSRQTQYHVKLGEGGIREVEFFVQALQMLYGGLKPELKSPNTLNTLRALWDTGLIEAKDARLLKEAYIFLRTLEHRLQLVEEQQVHRLPESHEERLQLARRMGYDQESPETALEQLEKDLTRHRKHVSERFRELLEQNSKGAAL